MKKQIYFFIIFILFILEVEAQPLSLSYYTGFDSTSEQVGWKEFRLGAISFENWEIWVNPISPSPPNSLYHHFSLDSLGPSGFLEDWFVSPPLKIVTRSKISVKVNVINIGFDDPFSYIGLFLGSGTNDPAKSNFIELVNMTYCRYKWVDTFAYITTITDTGYIAFKYKGNDLFSFEVLIDNVSITPDTSAFISENFIQNNAAVLYPNPSNGTVTITIANSRTIKGDLVIYNVLGLAVYSQILNSRREVINLNLPDGIYFYKVFNKNEEIAVGKIIVQ